tara:strand:- start:733 stop:900 length:168 start_codon:yes stop_codon:yes gene_type:complete
MVIVSWEYTVFIILFAFALLPLIPHLIDWLHNKLFNLEESEFKLPEERKHRLITF